MHGFIPKGEWSFQGEWNVGMASRVTTKIGMEYVNRQPGGIHGYIW